MATTWMADANEAVAPRLGLPVLPYIEWSDDTDEPTYGGLHWKTRELVAWAAGRPFIWIDDEITSRDREWVSIHHGDHALLHRVEARVGLTDADFELIRRWLTRGPAR